jgi:hypothetical protein
VCAATGFLAVRIAPPGAYRERQPRPPHVRIDPPAAWPDSSVAPRTLRLGPMAGTEDGARTQTRAAVPARRTKGGVLRAARPFTHRKPPTRPRRKGGGGEDTPSGLHEAHAAPAAERDSLTITKARGVRGRVNADGRATTQLENDRGHRVGKVRRNGLTRTGSHTCI